MGLSCRETLQAEMSQSIFPTRTPIHGLVVSADTEHPPMDLKNINSLYKVFKQLYANNSVWK